jgi:hypothetical protein
MTAPQPPRSSDITPRATDLKVSRVAAAALAAVTTALLGSRLGAEGTLIGAAGASMITTVATSVYQASLERSRERVRSLAHRTRSAHPAAVDTLPAEDRPPTGKRLDDNADQLLNRTRRSTTWRWAGVVIAALGGFGLAMLMITGFEWASGETVGGNGKGTTIGQVVNDQSGPQHPNAPPAGPASETSTETPTETSEPPATTTTAPSGGGIEQSPAKTPSTGPSPSETPAPPLIPPLPRIGD